MNDFRFPVKIVKQSISTDPIRNHNPRKSNSHYDGHHKKTADEKYKTHQQTESATQISTKERSMMRNLHPNPQYHSNGWKHIDQTESYEKLVSKYELRNGLFHFHLFTCELFKPHFTHIFRITSLTVKNFEVN